MQTRYKAYMATQCMQISYPNNAFNIWMHEHDCLNWQGQKKKKKANQIHFPSISNKKFLTLLSSNASKLVVGLRYVWVDLASH